ncbi:MAG TPA: response regulator transcription factor [Parafilimonas sp.]|nr:response regulator transcription factor [Parafilimonas sp.]
MATVCIVEDLEDIRNGIAAIINMTPEFKVLQTFANAEEALELLLQLEPDIVIMDIHLPGISGIECMRRVHEKNKRIQFMMFTIYENSDTVFEALAAGATGYILKNSSAQKIIESLNELCQGGSPMNAEIAKKLVKRFQQQSSSLNEYNLTPKEQKIVELMAKGYLYKEIAGELKNTVNTIKQHIRHIYEKLHVQNKAEAINKIFLK